MRTTLRSSSLIKKLTSRTSLELLRRSVWQGTKEDIKAEQDQVIDANSAFILKNLLISRAHGTRTCIKRQKIAYGKFFDFWADEYIYKRIPEDENPPMKGF